MRRTCYFTLLLTLGIIAAGCQGGALEYGGEVKDSPALETPPLESLSGEETTVTPPPTGGTTETPATGTVAEGGTGGGETVTPPTSPIGCVKDSDCPQLPVCAGASEMTSGKCMPDQTCMIAELLPSCPTPIACAQDGDCPQDHYCSEGACYFKRPKSRAEEEAISRSATGSQHTDDNARIGDLGRGTGRGSDDLRQEDGHSDERTDDARGGDDGRNLRGKACVKNVECMPGLCVNGVCQSADNGDLRQDAGRVDDGRTDAGWMNEGDLSRKPTLRSSGTNDDVLAGGNVATKSQPGDTTDAPATGITITPKNFAADDALETPVVAIVEDSSKEFFWIQIAAKVADGNGGWTNPLVMVQGNAPPDVSLACKDFENGPLVTEAKALASPQQNTYALVIGYKYPHYATMGHQPAVIEKALQCTMTVTAGGQTVTWPVALHLRGRAPLLNGKSGVVNTTIEPVGNGFQSFGTLYIHPAANGVGIASAAKDKVVEPLFVVSDVNQDATEAPFYTTCAPAAPAYSIIKKQADGSYHIRPTYVVEAIKPMDGAQHQCTVMVKDSQGNPGWLNLILQWVIKPPAMEVTPEAKDEAVQPVPSPGPAKWALISLNIEPVNFAVGDTLWLVGDVNAGWQSKLDGAIDDMGTEPIVRVTGSSNAPMYQLNCVSGLYPPFAGKFIKQPTPTGSVGDYYRVDLSYDFSKVPEQSLLTYYYCTAKAYNGVDPDKTLGMHFEIAPKLFTETCVEEYINGVICSYGSDTCYFIKNADVTIPKEEAIVKSCP